MQFRRFLRFLLSFGVLGLGIVPDDGGGSDVDSPTTASPDAADNHAADVTNGAELGAGATDPSKPSTMLEAMFGPRADAETVGAALPGETQEQTAERLRDEKGRFAAGPRDAEGKPIAAQAKPGEQPAAKPGDKPEHQMPEGLKPEAQQRFQHLVNTNKEMAAKLADSQPIVDSALQLQETFQTNGVRREQFDQAMQVVGMMNKGDLEGALRVLDEQRALISMHLGKPLPGADALANFPDLRDDVDNLRIPEARALEIARSRTIQSAQSQTHQREQREQQTQQQAQQAHHQGTLAVDAFCKQAMKTDMDYAVIEPLLLKEIQGGLLQGVPANLWAGIVEKTYRLIKQTAGTVRSQAPATNVLRPTGGESPRQTPRNMHEAMWGGGAKA